MVRLGFQTEVFFSLPLHSSVASAECYSVHVLASFLLCACVHLPCSGILSLLLSHPPVPCPEPDTACCLSGYFSFKAKWLSFLQELCAFASPAKSLLLIWVYHLKSLGWVVGIWWGYHSLRMWSRARLYFVVALLVSLVSIKKIRWPTVFGQGSCKPVKANNLIFSLSTLLSEKWNMKQYV